MFGFVICHLARMEGMFDFNVILNDRVEQLRSGRLAVERSVEMCGNVSLQEVQVQRL